MHLRTLVFFLSLPACLEPRFGTEAEPPDTATTVAPQSDVGTTPDVGPEEVDAAEPPKFDCDIDVVYDDDNACTIDGCSPDIGIFHRLVDDPACMPGCSLTNAVSPSELRMQATIGLPAKTYGALVAQTTIRQMSMTTPVGPSITLLEEAVSDPSGPSRTGRSYLVWGTGRFHVAGGSFDDDVDSDTDEPHVNAIELGDWCLQVDDLTMLGAWDAVLDIEGEVLARFRVTFDSGPDGPLTFRISHVTTEGTLAASFDATAFAAQRELVLTTGGSASFSLTLPWKNRGPEVEQVVLYAQHEDLRGQVGPLFFDGDEDETLPFGHLTLEPAWLITDR